MEQQQDEANLHFLDYWRVIRSRKEIILAVTLLVVVTGTAFTLMLPKHYMADARILVREDAMDVDVFERQMPPGYNPFFLRTQYEIIQSRQILYQVINNLNLQQVWGEKLNEDGSPLDREDAYAMLSRQREGGAVPRHQPDRHPGVPRESRRRPRASPTRSPRSTATSGSRMKRREIKRAIEALENEMQKQQDKVEPGGGGARSASARSWACPWSSARAARGQDAPAAARGGPHRRARGHAGAQGALDQLEALERRRADERVGLHCEDQALAIDPRRS